MLVGLSSTGASAQSPMFTWSSPRSIALGGVSTTGFKEPATMHLNPAALVEIERFTMSSGLAGNVHDQSITMSDSTNTENLIQPAMAPHVTAAVNFGSRLVCAGFSLNTFDTYRMYLPGDSMARYQGTDLTLYSGGFDVALGFMPIRDLAFGFKLGLMGAKAGWNRRVSPFNNDPDPDFDMRWNLDMETTSEYSVLVGAIWSPGYRFKLGMTYRPEMRYQFDSTIETELPDPMGGERISSGTRPVNVTIPQELRLGFHWLASERMDLYMDLGWTQNSGIDPVVIEADDPKPPYIDPKLTVPFRQDDAWHGHLGLEYMVSGFFTLRAGGFYYTGSDRPDYSNVMIPDSAHWGVTSGVGFHFFEWDIDVAGGWIDYDPISMNGSAYPAQLRLSADKDVSQYTGAVSVRYHF